MKSLPPFGLRTTRPCKPSRTKITNRSLRVENLEDRMVLSTFVVTSDADSGAGSLRQAILDANDEPGADTIRFAGNVRGDILLTTELTITDDLTIHGPGAEKLTVSGQGATRVFRVDSDPTQPFGLPLDEAGDPLLIDVAIRGLTIADGQATDAPGFPPTDEMGDPLFPGFGFGGGLFNRGSNVTLVGVNMIRNLAGDGSSVALAAGGAIANEFGGTLTIRHSHFSQNAARGLFLSVGGAITQDIGPTADGLGTDSPSAEISHSSFEANTAESIFSDPDAAGPFAPFAGWAIGGAVADIAGSLNVSHTSFEANVARGGNGSIDLFGTGDPPVLSQGDGGNGIGGAIFVDDFSPFDVIGVPGRDAFLDVRHSQFSDNAAYGGDAIATGSGGQGAGGAIGFGISYDESFGFSSDSGVVRHSVFQQNLAEGGDGGADGGAGGVATGGGIALLTGANVDVNYSHFTHNSVRGGQGTQAGRGGDGLGGAIGVGTLILTAPFPPTPPFPVDQFVSSLNVHHSFFFHNQAFGGGGGVAGDGGNGLGGAIGTAGPIGSSFGESSTNVSRSMILANRAVGGEGGSGLGGNGQGGGVFNGDDSMTTLAHDFIFANLAVGGVGGVGQGGGVFNSEFGDLEIDKFTWLFTRFNHASDEGDNIFEE